MWNKEAQFGARANWAFKTMLFLVSANSRRIQIYEKIFMKFNYLVSLRYRKVSRRPTTAIANAITKAPW